MKISAPSLSLFGAAIAIAVVGRGSPAVSGFAPPHAAPESSPGRSPSSGLSKTGTSTTLGFFKGGTGAKDLDEEWENQQEVLKLRRASGEDRKEYFEKVEDRRWKATEELNDKWAWQKKNYKKGEDPIDEWKKRRASGQISDLEDQYGDPKKKGGIPFPMASFGQGGEFGVGGKFDNGGRFDLRLPYAEQGYVDEEAEPLFSNWFGGDKKKKQKKEADEAEALKRAAEDAVPEKKNPFWPF